MGSSRGQDRSLGGTGGITLPQWIKGRADSRYDFDQSSFSPPSHDDNFFCIRYSANKPSEKQRDNLASGSQQEGYRSISQVLLSEKTNSGSTDGHQQVNGPSGNISNIKEIKKNIDFSKHPLPCQPFIPAEGGKEKKTSTAGAAASASAVAGGFIANKFKVAKSQGTDDGFHSEPALCGKSIVDVANRIMSGKLMKIDSANQATESKNASHNEQEHYLRMGSKSLPVTPIASPISTPDTSPKSRRRVQANRYFTVPERDKYQAGWILSSILGQSRDLMGTGKIQEVDEEEPPANDILPSKYLNRKKSISSQNLSYLGRNETRTVTSSSRQEQQQQQQQPPPQDSKEMPSVNTNVFQAKPSELREMNFWSPTSM